ncbi:MAG: OmpH family outer membrane protein [Akkermansiaceae bacterium]|nr:OmpH family outer membrane protein [Akkermansiaceae bacterium]
MLRAALVIGFLSLLQPALAGTRIAGVRVDEIFNRLKATQDLEVRTAAARVAVNKDPRLAAYRESLAELEALQKKIIEVSRAGGPDALPLQRLQREFAVKRGEAFTLQREFDEFRARRTQEINEEYVTAAEKLLAEIHRKAVEVAEKEGVDLVLDTGGNTNTSMSFVLYAKAPVDLTEQVMAGFEMAPETPPADPSAPATAGAEPTEP